MVSSFYLPVTGDSFSGSYFDTVEVLTDGDGSFYSEVAHYKNEKESKRRLLVSRSVIVSQFFRQVNSIVRGS